MCVAYLYIKWLLLYLVRYVAGSLCCPALLLSTLKFSPCEDNDHILNLQSIAADSFIRIDWALKTCWPIGTL